MKKIDYSECYKRTTAPFAIDRTGITIPKYASHLVRPIGGSSVEYIISGSGTVIENNKTFHVKAGDVLIFHARNYHEHLPNPSDPWRKIWVQISGCMAPQLLREYNLANVNHIPDFDLQEDLEKIQAVINQATDIETIDQEGPHLLLNLVQKIQNEVCRRDPSLQESTKAQIIRDMIDSVPNGCITLQQLCEESHFSKRHINRIFKEEYGITPSEYIQNRRLAIAQSLLKRTDLSIKEIADRLNFCTAAYLSQFFREQTGETPLEYRKKNRQS